MEVQENSDSRDSGLSQEQYWQRILKRGGFAAALKFSSFVEIIDFITEPSEKKKRRDCDVTTDEEMTKKFRFRCKTSTCKKILSGIVGSSSNVIKHLKVRRIRVSNFSCSI